MAAHDAGDHAKSEELIRIKLLMLVQKLINNYIYLAGFHLDLIK